MTKTVSVCLPSVSALKKPLACEENFSIICRMKAEKNEMKCKTNENKNDPNWRNGERKNAVCESVFGSSPMFWFQAMTRICHFKPLNIKKTSLVGINMAMCSDGDGASGGWRWHVCAYVCDSILIAMATVTFIVFSLSLFSFPSTLSLSLSSSSSLNRMNTNDVCEQQKLSLGNPAHIYCLDGQTERSKSWLHLYKAKRSMQQHSFRSR